MTQIQLRLTKEENQIVGMLKHLFDVVSKEEAIKLLIKSTGETLIADTVNKHIQLLTINKNIEVQKWKKKFQLVL